MHALKENPKKLTEHARCMLGSVKCVKSENPKGEGEFRKWEGGELKQLNKLKV